MRILHVSELKSGGVFTMLQHFTGTQCRNGDEVHVLGPGDMPLLPGVQMHEWKLERGRPVSYPVAWTGLRRCVRSVRPDVVHLHSFMAGAFGRSPGAVPASLPVVYQPHAWAFDLFQGPRRAAVAAWERHASRITSAIVTNCEDELRRGEEFGVRRWGVPVGIAVDTDHLRPPSPTERQAAKRQVGYDRRPVLLVLGRLAFQKAQDLLVQEWNRRPLPDVDLVFVGPGDPSPLQRLAADEWAVSVHHAGETADVRTWLWAADVLLIPSRYETVSLVAGEAMSVGLPVVATRFDGVAEAVFGDGSPAGAVVELGDMRSLLEAADARLHDRENWSMESTNGRRRASTEFSPVRVHDRLRAVYDRVVEQGGSNDHSIVPHRGGGEKWHNRAR